MAKKIEYMTITEMLNYAAEQYPKLKNTLIDEKEERTNNCYQRTRTQIMRTLEKYGVNTKHVPDQEQNKSNKDLCVPTPIAELVIDKIMADYFNENYGNIDKKAKARLESKIAKQAKNQLAEQSEKPTKEWFAEMNKQLNEQCAQARIEYQFEVSNGIDLSSDEVYKKPRTDSHTEDNGRYHIPIVGYEDYSTDFENKVLYEILCSFLNTFCDFNEKKFRNDLKERSNKIYTDESYPFRDGYFELTWKLENPIGNYILPKPKKRKN